VLNDDDVRMLTEYLRSDVFKCGPDELQVCGRPGQPTTGGTKEWRDIYSVLWADRQILILSASSEVPPVILRV
jgi:hypothetical protein